VCADGLLYGVTGPTGVLLPQGFTIDLVEDERYSVDLIATWSPDDKVFLRDRLAQIRFLVLKKNKNKQIDKHFKKTLANCSTKRSKR